MPRIVFARPFEGAQALTNFVAQKNSNETSAPLRIGVFFFDSNPDAVLKGLIAPVATGQVLLPLIGLFYQAVDFGELLLGFRGSPSHFAGGGLSVSLAALLLAGLPRTSPLFFLSCPVITVLASLCFCAIANAFFPLSFTHLNNYRHHTNCRFNTV